MKQPREIASELRRLADQLDPDPPVAVRAPTLAVETDLTFEIGSELLYVGLASKGLGSRSLGIDPGELHRWCTSVLALLR